MFGDVHRGAAEFFVDLFVKRCILALDPEAVVRRTQDIAPQAKRLNTTADILPIPAFVILS